MLLDHLLDRLINFFTSLRLTVVCLALALVLVFWGTLAQVDLGLYKAQNEFFRSFLIYWGPKGTSWRIPVFPGGYQSLIFYLFSRETLFHEDFFHAGKVVALKFDGISFYRPTACEL